MKTTIIVIIESELVKKLDNLAQKENRSRSNMLNRILENLFKSSKKENF